MPKEKFLQPKMRLYQVLLLGLFLSTCCGAVTDEKKAQVADELEPPIPLVFFVDLASTITNNDGHSGSSQTDNSTRSSIHEHHSANSTSLSNVSTRNSCQYDESGSSYGGSVHSQISDGSMFSSLGSTIGYRNPGEPVKDAYDGQIGIVEALKEIRNEAQLFTLHVSKGVNAETYYQGQNTAAYPVRAESNQRRTSEFENVTSSDDPKNCSEDEECKFGTDESRYSGVALTVRSGMSECLNLIEHNEGSLDAIRWILMPESDDEGDNSESDTNQIHPHIHSYVPKRNMVERICDFLRRK